MTTILQSFVVLVVLASPASAGVRHSIPNSGADVLHQQDAVQLDEEEEDEEEDEPDCE